MTKYPEYKIYNNEDDANKVDSFLGKMSFEDYQFRKRPEDGAFVIRTTKKGMELIAKFEAFAKQIDIIIAGEEKP